MNEGDTFLVSENGKSNLCEIEKFENECVFVSIIEENFNNTNLPVKIYLFQGLPKADKMELIIQKGTELGVNNFVPVELKRSIVKLSRKR